VTPASGTIPTILVGGTRADGQWKWRGGNWQRHAATGDTVITLKDGGNPPMETNGTGPHSPALRDDPEGNNNKRGKRATMEQWKWRVPVRPCCLEAGAQHTNQ